MGKVKIVVVDDSAFMRKAISELLEEEPTFEVIAKFRDGRELIDKIDKYKPDIITLDVHMKELDGLSTLKELKRLNKEYPVIMLSSSTTEGSALTLECLDNGAISFIAKPSGNISLDIDKIQEDLISQVKSIVGNSSNKKSYDIKKIEEPNIEENKKVDIFTERKIIKKAIVTNQSDFNNKVIDAVVIGASTGGPKALQSVLCQLPNDLNVPVFVVQHMPEGFTKVFAERLDRISNMTVVEAEEGMEIEKNVIYIAKGGSHMTVTKQKKIALNQEPAIWGVRPAVDKLFDSAVNVYGSNLLSVVLTGMGRDGAKGTSNVKDNGGVTIAEDESTCTIYGMPKAAYETGKVDLVVPLNQVSEKITKLVKRI